MPNLEHIATVYDPEEAHVACGFLNANGIDAILGDAATLSALPFHRIALGGHRILAPSSQAHAARMLMATVDGGDKAGGYEFDGLQCGNCGGDRFTRVKPWALPALLLFLFGTPLWWNSRRLRCTECGAIKEANAAEKAQ